MNEKENKTNIKSILILFVVACALALIMGLVFRPLVSRAAEPEDATLTDARERLKDIQTFRESVATSSDAVDKSPYLTNDVAPLPLQTNDLLLSIRNILVCMWFTIVFVWIYDRLKVIIFRLGGVKKQ